MLLRVSWKGRYDPNPPLAVQGQLSHSQGVFAPPDIHTSPRNDKLFSCGISALLHLLANDLSLHIQKTKLRFKPLGAAVVALGMFKTQLGYLHIISGPTAYL